jgi:hypothetical protein
MANHCGRLSLVRLFRMVSRFWKPSLITVCLALSLVTTTGVTKRAGTVYV